MRLYSYWRSTASYRVRIALAWKGIDYIYVPEDLLEGAQQTPFYTAVNPVKAVPSLVLADGRALTQSMAILDYLEELQPAPALLPKGTVARAEARAAALGLATDVHPVNNLKVSQRLLSMGHSEPEVMAWMRHWTSEGLSAFQARIRAETPFAFGDTPSWADICLVAQLYNGHRWGVDMGPFARLLDIERACLELPAFQAAHPETQPDAS